MSNLDTPFYFKSFWYLYQYTRNLISSSRNIRTVGMYWRWTASTCPAQLGNYWGTLKWNQGSFQGFEFELSQPVYKRVLLPLLQSCQLAFHRNRSQIKCEVWVSSLETFRENFGHFGGNENIQREGSKEEKQAVKEWIGTWLERMGLALQPGLEVTTREKGVEFENRNSNLRTAWILCL